MFDLNQNPRSVRYGADPILQIFIWIGNSTPLEEAMCSEVQISELEWLYSAVSPPKLWGGVLYILPMPSHTFLTSRNAIMFWTPWVKPRAY